MTFIDELKFLEAELRALKTARPRSMSRLGTVETRQTLSMASGTTYQVQVSPVGDYMPMISYYLDTTTVPTGFTISTSPSGSSIIYEFRQTSGATVSLPVVFVSTSRLEVSTL